MNVHFELNEREAIPVRALAWMTQWNFSADMVAEAMDWPVCPSQFGDPDHRLDILPALKGGDSLYRGCMSAAGSEL